MIAMPRARLGELVQRHGGVLDEALDRALLVMSIGPSDEAPGGARADLAPVLHERGAARLTSDARVLLVAQSVATRVPEGRRWVHPRAELVLARLLEANEPPPFDERSVHPSAVLAGVRLHPGVRIGRDVVIGEDSVVEPNVVVFPGVHVGRGVVIGAGTILGRPGFRFVEGGVQVPHRAGVVVADGVAFGASCTVDAGILAPTRIGQDSKLDAQVHVGHGVIIGARCRIAAQVGLAGSVVVEDDVWIGGQAGVADHCTLGRGARIAAKAGVIGDVPAGAVFAGYPAVDRARWLRGHAHLYRLGRRTRLPR